MKKRLEQLLREQFPGLTGRQAEEAVRRGWIRTATGAKAKKGDRLVGLQELDTRALVAHLEKIRQGNPELRVSVLFQGEDFCVVDKPAGMPGHPLSLFDLETVTHWALAQFPRTRTEFPLPQPCLTPHRLDTGTSGCLIVALNRAGYERWRERFSRHEVTKRYLAWVWGEPVQDRWLLDKPIAACSDKRKRKVATAGEKGYQALTQVMVIRREKGCSLVEARCETGVTHQVRVHLASAGYPLVGDTLYDPRWGERPIQPAWHLLRAVELRWQGECYRALPTPFSEAVPAPQGYKAGGGG